LNRGLEIELLFESGEGLLLQLLAIGDHRVSTAVVDDVLGGCYYLTAAGFLLLAGFFVQLPLLQLVLLESSVLLFKQGLFLTNDSLLVSVLFWDTFLRKLRSSFQIFYLELFEL
jgi:hypothetical protein